MASEQTPLLRDEEEQVVLDHDKIYDRFSPSRKRAIVAVTALTGTFPMFASGSFIPLIPQIAQDLDSTGEVVSLAVSLSILANAIGSLTWAAYSGFYGRKSVILWSMATMAVGSFGAGAARTIPELLVWRIVQAFGASSGLAVGIGVLADIYRLEERGRSSGIFFGAILFGMSIAPTIGGVTAHYYSWRTTQYGLCVAGLASFLLTLCFQPETSWPGKRGVDKLIEKEGRARWVWLNPFGSIALLRSPNVSLISLSQGLVVLTDYVLLVPIAYTIAAKYHITNEAVIGALCIPVGIGNIIGSTVVGRLSDSIVVSMREKRGGVWVPEDRLRATTLGGLVLAPLSVIASGVITQFANDGVWMMLLNFVCLFLNGAGVSAIFNPGNAYLVDILHSRSAEVTAANMACRNLVIAAAVGFILPSINNFGIFATFSASAVVAWIGYGCVVAVLQYGGRMRAWIDLGFSTAANN
ncbi:MFS general substrate transporter [Phanerochaete sordida]|uniref:MFS general substrate transporter n=1 Tax=Phanerochaete sordida TaxID=48140 RepID=A0A9P3G4L1_9APHY|nr:MFS general substrate transporter [Phanerochaete sordida]